MRCAGRISSLLLIALVSATTARAWYLEPAAYSREESFANNQVLSDAMEYTSRAIRVARHAGNFSADLTISDLLLYATNDGTKWHTALADLFKALMTEHGYVLATPECALSLVAQTNCSSNSSYDLQLVASPRASVGWGLLPRPGYTSKGYSTPFGEVPPNQFQTLQAYHQFMAHCKRAPCPFTGLRVYARDNGRAYYSTSPKVPCLEGRWVQLTEDSTHSEDWPAVPPFHSLVNCTVVVSW